MSKLVIDSIIKYLGQPLKKCGKELIWQCPICMDKGKDNLKSFVSFLLKIISNLRECV